MRIRVFALLVGAWLSPWAMAGTPSPEVEGCLQAAAEKHGVAYVLLRAIAEQESGFNPQALGRNTNGSYDVGLMQINTGWQATLNRFGIGLNDLYKPCVSADVGAWLLASNFRSMGVSWRAIGAYNAVTEWKRVQYAHKVHGRLQKYLSGGVAPAVAQEPQALAQQSVSGIGAWEGGQDE